MAGKEMGKRSWEPKTEKIGERCCANRELVLTGRYTKYLDCFSGIMNIGNANLEKRKHF